MKRLLIAILAICLTLQIDGATPSNFHHYTYRDLGSSSVTAICQDRYGLMWIGTDYGLCRFDGYQFTHYLHHHNDRYSLPHNNICCLLSDSQGRLWIGTNKSLSLYDFNTNHFNVIPFPKGIQPRVSSIIETKHRDIFVATSGYGLYIIYYGGNKLCRVPGLDRKLHEQFLAQLCEDVQGNIWCSGQNDISYRISIKHGKATNVSRWSNAPGSMRGYFVDGLGRLLRITGKGITAFNPHTNQFVDAGYQIPAEMINAGLSCIGRAADGGLWIGTERGIYKIAKGSRTAKEIEYAGGSLDLSKLSIHNIFSDRNGNLWAACFHNGLFLMNSRRLPFHSWTLSTQSPACPGDISSIAPAQNGGVWACTWGNGIYHFNAEGIVTQHLTFSSNVQRITPRHGGGYWVCTEDGVYQMDDHGSSRLVVAYEGFKTAICEDNKNALFIAVSGIGLVKYDLRTKQISVYSSKDKGRNGQLCNDWVSALVIDKNRYLWISTTSGLCCMDLRTGSFHPFGWASLLDGISINKMSILPNQDVAVATESGLYLYQRKTRKLVPFPNSSALEDQQIYNLQTDEHGDMWISTPTAIWYYDHKRHSFVSYGSGYGQSASDYLCNVSYLSPDGRIAFGTNQGVTVFNPHTVRMSSARIERLMLTSIDIDGKWFSPQESEIDIAPDENALTLSFSLLDYQNTGDVFYEYRLNKGSWVSNDLGDNKIVFNRMRPGTYLLEVRAVYGGHVVSDVKSLKLIIHAPWYATGVAFLVYFLLFCCLVYIGVRLYLQYKHRQLDEEKMQFLINAMHDVRSPLTLITNPLQKLLSEEKDEKKRSLLKVIERNSLRISQLVNQILDKRKLDKERMQLHCQYTNLRQLIQGDCKLYEYEAKQRNITFRFDHDEDVLAWVDRLSFDKVIGNLLSNAFKYTEDGGEVCVNLSAQDDHAVIKVLDTGIGLGDSKKANHIFERFSQGTNAANLKVQGTGIGLDLCRSVVTMHHGTITAANRSDVEHGACFTVSIPLGKDHLKPEEIIEKNSQNDTDKILPSASRSSSGIHVMFLDDDQELANYVSYELSNSFKMTIFHNGQEALKALLDDNNKFDIVVSDIVMPEMDGITLLKRIKENPSLSGIPVVLLSSKASVNDRLKGLKCGTEAFLPKPFEIDELRLTIKNLVMGMRKLKGSLTVKPLQEEAINKEKVVGNDDKLMERIVKAVHEHLSDPDYNVEQLADDVGLSRSQLHRRMKEMTGVATGKFVRDMRLKEAAHLLKLGTLNVSQVAYRVGFVDQAHFSTVFKKYYGVSPSDYGKE
jgi:signal transduction histidine kinase/ligand-binding sensor domain-containing protein/AraC-like DNA-binding protein